MSTDKPANATEVGGLIDPVAMPGLGADRTTAQIVADIVAANPIKHGVTLEERKRRAEERARAEAEDARKFFEEEDGGDERI